MNAKAGSARQSKQRRSYDPLFQQVWAVYPKAEEKAESAEEWPKALERLQEGEPDLEPMTPAEAANFLEQAAIDYSSKMHGREARYIRSMRRWLNNRTYLDYKQQPKVEYHDISYDQAFAEHLPTGSEGR